MVKYFKKLGIFLLRILGVVVMIVAGLMLCKSIGFVTNLVDILKIGGQIEISALRLFGVFLCNIVALIFDWCIAVILVIVGMSMMVYESKIIDKIDDSIEL